MWALLACAEQPVEKVRAPIRVGGAEETGPVRQRTATIFTTLLRVRYGTFMIFLAPVGRIFRVSV